MAAKKSKTAKSGAGGPHRTGKKKRASPATKKKRPAVLHDKISPETNGLATGTQAHQELCGALGGLLAIYDGMFDGLLIADRQTHEILQANSTICRMLGYAEDELAGMSVKDIHPPDALPQVLEKFETLVEGQDRLDRGVPFQRKDGSVFYADVGASGGPVEYEGRPCAIGVIRDVTDRIRAEEALRESEERWRSLAENAPCLILVVNPDHTIWFINQVPPGFTVEETIGTSVYDYIRPEHHNVVRETIQRVFQTGEPGGYNITGDGPHGRDARYETKVGPIKCRDQVVGVTLICTDVTERERAEEALRESEQRARSLLDSSCDSIVLIDLSGTIINLNEVTAQRLNGTVPQLIGKSAYQLFSPEVLETRKAQVEEVVRARRPLRFEEEREGMLLESMVSPVFDREGNVTELAVSARDITERKRAEEALRESEERYRHVFERAPIGVALVTLEGRILSANHAAQAITGHSLEELRQLNVVELYEDPADRTLIVERVMRDGCALDVPIRLKRKDGAPCEAIVNTSRIRVAGEDVLHTTILDVSERNRMQAELRESEEMYRKLVEASPDAVTAMDMEGRITYASRRTAELHGYQRAEELLGKSVLDLICPEYHETAATTIQTALKEGVVRSVEGDLLRKDGTRFAGEISAALVTGAAGEPKGLIGTTRDVTDRRRAEQALRESEELYRGLVEASPNAVIVTDLQARITHVSRRTCELFGLERAEDLLGRDGLQLVAPEDRQKAMANLQETLEKGLLEHTEYTLLRKDGTRVIAEVNGRLIRDSRGKPTAFLTTARDVTKRKRVEEALHESEERYRAVFEQAADSIVLLETEAAALVEFNDRAHENLGYTREEFNHLKIADFEVLESPEEVIKHAEKIVKKGSDIFETKHRTKGGEIRDVQVSSRAISIGGRDLIHCIFRDVTESNRAEQALRESQERYQAIFEQAADSIVLVDVETGAMVQFNTSAHEKLGYTREEFERLELSDFEVIESAEDVARHIERVVKEGPDTFETKHRTKDGEIRNIQVSTRVISIGGKDFIQGIFRDVTDRKRAERALRESQQRYQAIFEQAADSIVLVDATGALVEFNASTYEKLGYTREEFERLKVHDFEVFESAKDVVRHIERIVKEEPDTFETKHRTKDGEIRNIQVSTRVISIGGKDFVQGIWRDVTQRRRAEEALREAHEELERRVEERTAELLMANRQLKQEMEDRKRAQEALRESERLAATGRLAARVAHEINNPLAGIMNSFQLVKQAVPKDHRHYEFAELIEKEIARIGGIVRQMFELYRPDQEKIREVPVAETIDEVVAMLEPSCRDHGVHVEIHVDCPAAIVRAPEGSLRQVLYNLLANAAEASPRGGVIEVAVAAIEDERAVQITVSDQGPGIPEEVQEHVFEPFFTTKSSDASGGIGLGLSISRGIVDSLHGSLDFKTEPGKGTSFRLLLPPV